MKSKQNPPLPLDDLDKEILREVARLSHSATISEILKPFKGKRAWSSLYGRLRLMEGQGLLKTDKQKHYVFVTITERGLAIAGAR